MAAFVTSDVGAAACADLVGRMQLWGANSLAHFAMGTILGVLRFNLQVSHLVIWSALLILGAKEIFFDIPGAGFDWRVMLDSLWDVACYLLGLGLVFWAILSAPGPEAAS